MSHHSGSCHCGKVQFEVDLDLDQLMTCNCSICGRSGALMAFVPRSALTVRSGLDALTDYQFGKKSIHHAFCSTCGVRAFGWGTTPDGAEMAMVNARSLDGVDVHQLKVAHQYDGRSL